MNLKLSSFLVAAIALSLSAGCVSQAHAAPLSVGGVQQYKLAERQNDLGLSDEQKAKMRQMQSEAQEQIKALLTDSQKAQWQDAIANHKKLDRSFWDSMKLSPEQKSGIQKIKHDTQEAIFNQVLTAEQQQKVQAMRSQKHSPHQQPPQ